MSERLADVRARIAGVEQLGSVVNAMRGIAAARAQAARNRLAAVDAYAQTIVSAIGRALPLTAHASAAARREGRRGLVAFGAEQGFAGGFSERVFDALGADLAACELFLVGARAAVIAGQRDIQPFWTGAMPSHSDAAPKFADRIAQKIFERIAVEEIVRLDMAFVSWRAGRGFTVERARLFPLDPSLFPRAAERIAPLIHLDADALLSDLAGEYLHAELCRAILHSFAAENQARVEAMASTRRQVDRMLASLRADERRVRQEEITDEIIELAAGQILPR
ncbi:FoF1 ATP synthase subunit gamma [Rhodoblastus sp.]|jgi:F-type H+-transporting ATPase subunit gamma|uniref:F0F1 ATP synthase subunit gamma n=1 Tax=Rhodoblastus sp. TaxID=1962975 RepID=UPI00262A5CF8|nr:FoF1 ATP synthase subunit gamma [Rhodoblastus sp.]